MHHPRFFGLCIIVVIVLPVFSFAPASATVGGGSLWYTVWPNFHDYEQELGGPENASVRTTMLAAQYGFRIDAALAVSIDKYDHQDPPNKDRVRFHFTFDMESWSPENYTVVTWADNVCLRAIKDNAPGSNWNRQQIEWLKNDSTPGFCQGCNLTKVSQVPASPLEKVYWASDGVSYALDIAEMLSTKCIDPMFILDILVNAEYDVACTVSGNDYHDANYTDTYANTVWTHHEGEPWSAEPIRQYAFETVDWCQDHLQPSTYFGLLLYADVELSQNAQIYFGTTHLYLGPLYLRIYNSDYLGGGGGEGCPTLFPWNGDTYVNYGVINIHNPSGEDVIREVSILSEDLAAPNYLATIRLREGYPGLNFSESEIDQVKLYAVQNDGTRYACPLINAVHSRLGNVWLKLLLSDNWRTQTLLNETIDLTFFMPIQNAATYTFRIEGCNRYKA